MPSPFLERPTSDWVASNALAFALRDSYPGTPGHTLIIPKREVATWFDATAEEQAAIMGLITEVKRALDAELRPDGYNVGFNAGEAAGQTVMHLHVHVIPRFAGDVPDPRDGVRHVIPGKGNYLEPATNPYTPPSEKHLQAAEATAPYRLDTAPTLFGPAPHQRPLITGDATDPLLPHLLAHMDHTAELDVAVAFVMARGVDQVSERLTDLLERKGTLRLLTGDYLGATDPDALVQLLDLHDRYPEQVTLRVYEARKRSFHPKTYVLRRRDGTGIAFVGSSNLSEAALSRGVEWNYRIVSHHDRDAFAQVCASLATLLADPAVVDLTRPWIDSYRSRRPNLRPAPATQMTEPAQAEDEPLTPPEPDPIQREALDALEDSRADGDHAGLVVLATGLGKTFLAAFDSNRSEFPRVLFVAHREEILRQAHRTFRRVRPEATLGLYHGEEKTPDADILFASVQTLSQPRHLAAFARDAFDYLIVDEFHHAHADTYRRLIDHFEPAFFLGLTATPDRTDGGDLLSLCGENIVYRADLFEGIERGRLAPFHYFGVPDDVDYANIPWRRLTELELTAKVATERRAENALEQLRSRGGTRTLAFCVSIRHAEFMRDFFTGHGLRVAAVHSGESSAPRAEALEQLARAELDVVITVDMFNEGVDIPSVDTILMLRPTDSKILWLQQLGRGLRKAEGKDHLRVIDYVGNHRTFLRHLQTLFPGEATDLTSTRAVIARLREQGGSGELPGGCHVTYDLEALDILDGVAKVPRKEEGFRTWLADFKERNERRPRAVEAFHAGFDPQGLPPSLRPWFAALRTLDALPEPLGQVLARPRCAQLLEVIQTTGMTRSYKMVLLLGWLSSGEFPGAITLEQLAQAFSRLAERTGPVALDVSVDLNSPAKVASLLRDNPIKAWTGTGSGGEGLFTFDGTHLTLHHDAPEPLVATFIDMVRELAEWRLAQYLHRRRQDRIQAVFEDDGTEIDAHFTSERTPTGYAVIVESRGGTGGSKAARNTKYNRGLTVLIERLKRVGATLDRSELWTREVSGQALELKSWTYPIELATVEDVEQLRKEIQAAQGNNPTRRIRLLVSGVAWDSLTRFHRWLSLGRGRVGG